MNNEPENQPTTTEGTDAPALWTWCDPKNGTPFDRLWDDENNAVEDFLDDLEPEHWPATLDLAPFKLREVREFMVGWRFEPLEAMIEALDDEFGPDPADHPCYEFEPSAELVAVEKALIDLLSKEYQPWMCEPDTNKSRVRVNVADWVLENRPSWAKENEDVRAFVS